ncbi:MAG TPA: hypothetical protein VK787_00810 [Puia sp.]|nr:hypothetical protein [Puia sp.]
MNEESWNSEVGSLKDPKKRMVNLPGGRQVINRELTTNSKLKTVN